MGTDKPALTQHNRAQLSFSLPPLVSRKGGCKAPYTHSPPIFDTHTCAQPHIQQQLWLQNRLQEILSLPFGPDSTQGGNGAYSSSGPYQASGQQHPRADWRCSSDRSAGEIQKERQRGEGTRQRQKRGGGMGKTGDSPRFLVYGRRLSLQEQRLPAPTQPSPAQPALP